MKYALAVALAALLSPEVARAQSGAAPVVVFSCSLGAKTVSVKRVGKTLIYSFGAPGQEEISIVGSPSSKNVFWMAQRYAGMEYQLRFTKGAYSYVVFSAEGNEREGASATSGLVVMQGTKQVADMACLHYSEFATDDFADIPEDTEAYTAM